MDKRKRLLVLVAMPGRQRGLIVVIAHHLILGYVLSGNLTTPTKMVLPSTKLQNPELFPQ
jgi:hypothetical protein